MFDYCITAHDKDPLGAMLLDYLHGEGDVFVDVESPTLDMWRMSGEKMFRNFSQMVDIERMALSMCHGRVLDVGAGSGCHSLVLQEKQLQVDAIDISPGCVEVMERRGVHSVAHQNLFSHSQRNYATVLMLMNGLGICGTVDGLNVFFQFIRTILEPGGQILADSTDLSTYCGAEYLNTGQQSYYGETEFVMKYKGIVSDTFPWLYIDFDFLHQIAEYNGFSCERCFTSDLGKYLVQMIKQ